MGQLGAVNVAAQTFGGVAAGCPFRTGEILNLDASEVVMTGDSPSVRTATFSIRSSPGVIASAGGLTNA